MTTEGFNRKYKCVSATWNPWHGCKKISSGCLNCYVYRIDARINRDPSVFTLTHAYQLPFVRHRAGKNKGRYKLCPEDGYVYTCFSSDFFLEDADPYRAKAWDAIRTRQDLHFFIPTKRIRRFQECVPADWGDGYENVTIACTAENQAMADTRLPIFNSLPIRHREIIVEPMLERVDIGVHLAGVEHVTVGGESGKDARTCNILWVRDLWRQCSAANVPMWFKQTGARFVNEWGEMVFVPRINQSKIAARYELWRVDKKSSLQTKREKRL